MSNGHDHPGDYHVIVLNADPAQVQADFNAQYELGYEFKGINEHIAVFYHEEKKKK